MTIRKPDKPDNLKLKNGVIPDVRKFDTNSSEIHKIPNLDAKTHEEQLIDILESGLLTTQKLACIGTLSATEQNYLKVLLSIHQALNPVEGQVKKVEVSVKNEYDNLSSEELLALATELHTTQN